MNTDCDALEARHFAGLWAVATEAAQQREVRCLRVCKVGVGKLRRASRGTEYLQVNAEEAELKSRVATCKDQI